MQLNIYVVDYLGASVRLRKSEYFIPRNRMSRIGAASAGCLCLQFPSFWMHSSQLFFLDSKWQRAYYCGRHTVFDIRQEAWMCRTVSRAMGRGAAQRDGDRNLRQCVCYTFAIRTDRIHICLCLPIGSAQFSPPTRTRCFGSRRSSDLFHLSNFAVNWYIVIALVSVQYLEFSKDNLREKLHYCAGSLDSSRNF